MTVVNFEHLTSTPDTNRLDQIMRNVYADYYTGPERRVTPIPRRSRPIRRHRLRSEALVSDCRLLASRRVEDEEGNIEISRLYLDEQVSEN